MSAAAAAAAAARDPRLASRLHSYVHACFCFGLAITQYPGTILNQGLPPALPHACLSAANCIETNLHNYPYNTLTNRSIRSLPCEPRKQANTQTTRYRQISRCCRRCRRRRRSSQNNKHSKQTGSGASVIVIVVTLKKTPTIKSNPAAAAATVTPVLTTKAQTHAKQASSRSITRKRPIPSRFASFRVYPTT